jgi:hypothetical protein
VAFNVAEFDVTFVADPVVAVGADPPGAPAWVTVKVWPAMVIVPVRCDVLALAATE